ncbi:hypothetical protein LTR36_000111 [Oleoguttula mirabilis]|uniref:Uncharacterized protein n=1 Tax=Oleoguttula mirabilis TaxID=1507867 RepID=A0AAV9JZD6_9PEZI|nr:hypothetical protein LTR36_000111 [Oleoguttula mirabilis]
MLLFILLVAAWAGYASAQTSTIQLFIDNEDPSAQWGASVIEACNGSTTYAIVCTSAPLNDACSSGASAITITEGPSVYIVTTEAVFSETSATITESCSFDNAASSAACVQTIFADGYGQNVATTTSFNLTGQYYHRYAVEATAGVKKLDGTGSCSGSGSSSSSASNIGLQGTLAMAAVIVTTLGMVIVL